MEPVTPVTEEHTSRDVKFPVVKTDNGYGFEVSPSEISVAGEPFEPSSGLPRTLVKITRRQPKFGLRLAKVNKIGKLLFEFDKPLDQIDADKLEQHIFVPMARKIKRSWRAARSTEQGQHGRQRNSSEGYVNQAPTLQGSY